MEDIDASSNAPRCLDLESWRKPTGQERSDYFKGLTGRRKRKSWRGSLSVRTQLTTLDMYCYLKARFGEPNGLQSLLRSDDSDNLFHWDFNLKVGDDDLYIGGMSREIHLMVAEPMTDDDWRTLILAIKGDFGRVGPLKSAVHSGLEKWAVFPNKFVAIAGLCADHHATILDVLADGDLFKFDGAAAARANPPPPEDPGQARTIPTTDPDLYGACLQLSLLTPIMAEAFVNMVILMLCRPEVRKDRRQYDAFIRDNIDRKIFDLFYKCEGFAAPVDMTGEIYKAFKRVMDKRNHAIHGNVDPVAEQVDLVYFEGKRPLYPTGGDHIGQFHASLAKHYRPEEAIADYEATYLMLLEIAEALKPDSRTSFWVVMNDAYPGFDMNRKKCGHLFPERIVGGFYNDKRFDDDLQVTW